MCWERGLRKEWLYPDVPFIAEIWRFVLACSQTQVYAWCALSSCVNFSVTCTDLIKTGKLTTKRTNLVMTLIVKTFLLSVSKLTLHRASGFSPSTKTFCTKTRPASKTIFALSSGHGRCGVAVIRVSGPSCSEAVKSLCRQDALPPPRRAALKRLFDPTSREVIDKGLVLWFPGLSPHAKRRPLVWSRHISVIVAYVTARKKPKQTANNKKTDRQEYVFPRCMKGK